MRISQNAKNLITFFEGNRLYIYQDIAGLDTIGIGHLIADGELDKSILTVNNVLYNLSIDENNNYTTTQDVVDEIFAYDISRFEDRVRQLNLDINQNQFDAIVSFSFNLGLGALKNSTLLKMIKNNPLDENIKAEFEKWSNSGGKISKGLLKGRRAEANLYFGQDWKIA